MAKYNYWHVVTKVSKDWQKRHPKFIVGTVMTYPHKKDNEGVCMMDLKEGKEFPSAFTLSYLGRILKGKSGDELIIPLNRWIDKKGYRKIVDKCNDAKSDEGHSLTNTQLEINKIKKGCGKNIPTGLPPRIWDCTRPCGSDPSQLCKDCQAKLDILSALGDKEYWEVT